MPINELRLFQFSLIIENDVFLSWGGIVANSIYHCCWLRCRLTMIDVQVSTMGTFDCLCFLSLFCCLLLCRGVASGSALFLFLVMLSCVTIFVQTYEIFLNKKICVRERRLLSLTYIVRLMPPDYIDRSLYALA